MKKHQPEMVEIQLNKKEPSQKPASSQKTNVPYSRTIAKIETPQHTIEIYHGISPHLLHTIIQGISPHD